MGNEQPVSGVDLKNFQEKYGLSVIEMCFYFGLSSPNNYNVLIKTDVLPPTISLLYLLYSTFDEEIRSSTEPEEVYNKVQSFSEDDVSFRMFSILTGKAHTAYSSWVTKGVAPNKSTKRLLYLLNIFLEQRGKKGFKSYLQLVDSEAKRRNIEEIFHTLSWDS